MALNKDEFITQEDLTIRPQTPQEREQNRKDGTDIPNYVMKLDLSSEQQERLGVEFFRQFEALKQERLQLNLEKVWEGADAQYDGLVNKIARLKFNVSTKQSKIKVNAVVRACKEAFLDMDPKFSATPRPEFTRDDGLKVAEKQTDFLDYEMDENIQPENAYEMIFLDSAKKYVGVQKIDWKFKRASRKREEAYVGKWEPIGVGQNNQIILDNPGLREFVNQYPGAKEKYPGLVARLADNKEINIIVEFKEIIKNNAEIKHVAIENFYVNNSCKNNEDLACQHCIAERESYTWWELKAREEAGDFENVDQLISQDKKEVEDGKSGATTPDHRDAEYDVLEATMMFRVNEGDAEEIKIKAWFGEKSKAFLGAIIYPWYGIDIDYKGYWMKINNKGFYGDGEGIMWDLRDSNIAQDALLNLSLHGAYSRNIMTPITREGSEIEKLILENRWQEGLPLSVDADAEDVSKEIGFLQYPNMDHQTMQFLVQILKRQDGDVIGVSDLTSGRESQLDPKAPGNKTIALLQQSGINIQEYIRGLSPSFNETGAELLQLYYQMAAFGRRFRIRRKAGAVTGSDPFDMLTRDEMTAKTNIQTRASVFAFDKINEKAENLSMMQLLMAHPLALQNPALIYRALVLVMKSWSPVWKNLADTELPNPDQFQNEQRDAAIQGIQDLISKVQQQEKITGVAPPINLNVLTQAVQEAQQTQVLGAPAQEFSEGQSKG